MSGDDTHDPYIVYQQVDWIGTDSAPSQRYRAVCDRCGREGVYIVTPQYDGSRERSWSGFSLAADAAGRERPLCPECGGRSINITHQIPDAGQGTAG